MTPMNGKSAWTPYSLAMVVVLSIVVFLLTIQPPNAPLPFCRVCYAKERMAAHVAVNPKHWTPEMGQYINSKCAQCAQKGESNE